MRRESVRLAGQADLQRYLAVRAQTERLADPLSAEDCALQSMPDASPTKWHLGHTSWFFETFVLERALPDFSSYRTEFRVLFNSYYVGVGPRHPRHERGLLSRPSLDEVRAFRRSVHRSCRRIERTQCICTVSGLSARARCIGRVQRQVHGQPVCAARRVLRHAGIAHPTELSQLLSGVCTLAIHGNQARARRALGRSAPLKRAFRTQQKARSEWLNTNF